MSRQWQKQESKQKQADPIPDPTAPCGLVESVRLPTSDLVTQDKEINKRMNEGWTHYESLMVYGNEMILRFRR